LNWSGVARLAEWVADVFPPERPLVAIEVRQRSLGLVRIVRERRRTTLGSAAVLEIPEGVVRVSMTEPNLVDPVAFGRVLRSLIEHSGVADGARVAVVLPDATARIALLEAEGPDLEDAVRFRLRKAVPFDTREAQVAVTPLPRVGGAKAMALAAVIAGPVLDGYEAAFREGGLFVGQVELASLALLRFVGEGGGDRVFVNWDEQAVTFWVVRAGRPLVVRALPARVVGSQQELVREVGNTVLYYRERLGGDTLSGGVLRIASQDAQGVAERLAEPLGFMPEILSPWEALGTAPLKCDGRAIGAASAALLAEAG
jgi:hypothetical protein